MRPPHPIVIGVLVGSALALGLLALAIALLR
jgi:hypothetical protein